MIFTYPNKSDPLKTTYSFFSLVLVCLLLFAGCTKDPVTPIVETDPDPEPEDVTFDLTALNGNSQKGPFLNGSSVSIQELDSVFSMTGRSFTGTIVDNSGAYTFGQLTLVTPVVDMRTSGFYYNEVTGSASEAQLTLNALVDLTDKQRANINLLSHLARSRVVYLLTEEGLSFPAASDQARAEVLAMLSFTLPNAPDFDQLDISQPGAGNAILLAASVILQGRRTTAELSQLLADISADLRTDGVLSDPLLGSALITDVQGIDPALVRANLIGRYASVGITAAIPAFEPFLQQFIDNTPFEPFVVFEYPDTGLHGDNLLAGISAVRDTLYLSNNFNDIYSLSAIVPTGNALRLRITGDRSQGGIAYTTSTNLGWQLTSPTLNTNPTEFEVTRFDEPTDFRVLFIGASQLTFDVYENDATTPSRSRTIITGSLIDVQNDHPVYPDSLNGLPNLLALLYAGETTFPTGQYTFAVQIPATYNMGGHLNMATQNAQNSLVDFTSIVRWDFLNDEPPTGTGVNYIADVSESISDRGLLSSFTIELENEGSMEFNFTAFPINPSGSQSLPDLMDDIQTTFTWE